jgi:phosphatidylserine/phosphatidylglycerophosphate/cardiolipin synthase-like enzyme
MYPGMVHGKLILVDDTQVFVGSANLMTSSLDQMGEVSVLLRENRHIARKVRSIVQEDILLSEPLFHPPKLKWLGRWLALLGL